MKDEFITLSLSRPKRANRTTKILFKRFGIEVVIWEKEYRPKFYRYGNNSGLV